MSKFTGLLTPPLVAKTFQLTSLITFTQMNLLTRLLAPSITIDISLDYVLFLRDDYSLRLDTLAWVQPEEENVRILSLGDLKLPAELGAVKVYLFRVVNEK